MGDFLCQRECWGIYIWRFDVLTFAVCHDYSFSIDAGHNGACMPRCNLLWIIPTPPASAAVGLIVLPFSIYSLYPHAGYSYVYWSNVNTSQINQTITFFYKAHIFFLPLFLFRCSINITACCFHITHFPRQLVNKYDLHISDGVSHCMVQQRTVLSEQNQASSAVCPPTLSRESNVEARISKSFPCSPIKTSLHDNEPNTHNH